MKALGTYYLEAANLYGKTPELLEAFAAGFISGQAEKVFSGVCGAACFRPSEEHSQMVFEIVNDVSSRYGLHWFKTSDGEFWIFKDHLLEATIRNVSGIFESQPVLYHSIRASLCGIKEVDTAYHMREGFNVRCDPSFQEKKDNES